MRLTQLLRVRAVLTRLAPAFLVLRGAEDGTRTRDLLITNQLLYQLSYFGLTAERGEHATHSPSRKPERAA